MSNETFVRRCLACIIIADKLRALAWNLRDDGGQIPPPSPVLAIRDVRTILSAGDIPELVRDDASLFEKYAGTESAFSSIWWASIRIEHAAETHGLEWSDELRDALRFAIYGFPVETMACDARRELRSWMEEWIPPERRQSLIDEAEKPIGGGHGLRFTPTGGSGDANAPAEPDKELIASGGDAWREYKHDGHWLTTKYINERYGIRGDTLTRDPQALDNRQKNPSDRGYVYRLRDVMDIAERRSE